MRNHCFLLVKLYLVAGVTQLADGPKRLADVRHLKGRVDRNLSLSELQLDLPSLGVALGCFLATAMDAPTKASLLWMPGKANLLKSGPPTSFAVFR